jgi:cell division protein FtsW (lipid II flippase)
MDTILIWLMLLLTGTGLLVWWSLRIKDRDKRKAYMMGTHLATIVPGSVGIGNKLFPPENAGNFLLALVVTISIVIAIWKGVAYIYKVKNVGR